MPNRTIYKWVQLLHSLFLHLTFVLRTWIRLAFVCASFPTQTPWDVRAALEIGNSRYANTPTLYNVLNDAKAVAAALRSLGFREEMVDNGSKRKMERLSGAEKAPQTISTAVKRESSYVCKTCRVGHDRHRGFL